MLWLWKRMALFLKIFTDISEGKVRVSEEGKMEHVLIQMEGKLVFVIYTCNLCVSINRFQKHR